MSNILYPLLLLGVFSLGSCQKAELDAPLEDYDRLFPFKGAERPRISYEDQIFVWAIPMRPSVLLSILA